MHGPGDDTGPGGLLYTVAPASIAPGLRRRRLPLRVDDGGMVTVLRQLRGGLPAAVGLLLRDALLSGSAALCRGPVLFYRHSLRRAPPSRLPALPPRGLPTHDLLESWPVEQVFADLWGRSDGAQSGVCDLQRSTIQTLPTFREAGVSSCMSSQRMPVIRFVPRDPDEAGREDGRGIPSQSEVPDTTDLLCRDAHRFPQGVRDLAQRSDGQLLRGVRAQVAEPLRVSV